MRGYTCAYFFAAFRPNFKEYFKETPWMDDLESIFTPSKLKEESFYKKKILKPDEDVDGFGNKGFFEIKKGRGREEIYLVVVNVECSANDIIKRYVWLQQRSCFLQCWVLQPMPTRPIIWP